MTSFPCEHPVLAVGLTLECCGLPAAPWGEPYFDPGAGCWLQIWRCIDGHEYGVPV